MDAKNRSKSIRVLSTGIKASLTDRQGETVRPFLNEAKQQALLKENKSLKQEVLKIKEINVQYAKLLGELVEFHHGEESEKQTAKEKRLRQLNKNITTLNSNIKEELVEYRRRQQQLERLEKYLEANRFKDLSEFIARFEKQESIIQSQKHQLADHEDSIKKLQEAVADRTEVSTLRKTIKKQQDQNQKLEAKCAKLLDELQKSTKFMNQQKVQTYNTEIKLRELERKERQFSGNVLSTGNKENRQHRRSEFFS